MSEATQKFVDALAKGDNIEAGEMFKDALRDKVAASLDDRRKDLAQTIFSNNDENNGATNFSDPKPAVTDVSDRTDQLWTLMVTKLNLHQMEILNRYQQMKLKISNLMVPDGTMAFSQLPPLHKEVVTDFYKTLEKEEGSIIDRVERSIDKVADFHNVSTDVLYNYIDNETGI